MTANRLPFVWSPTFAEPQAGCDCLDRGALYGDGFFTTLVVAQGRVLNWAAHRQRLVTSAQRMGFPPLDQGALQADLAQSYALGPPAQAREVVKILITRGAGGRGYAPPEAPKIQRRVIRLPFPVGPEAHALRWELSLQASPVHWSRQPLLAGLKHLNRLENVLAQQALAKSQASTEEPLLVDAIMTDDRARVISTTQANLVLMRGDQLLTPRLDECGVAGTCLQGLKQALASEPSTRHWQWVTQDLSLTDLHAADAVFATNAVRGVMPVASLSGHKKSTQAVLPIHQAWLKWQSETAQPLSDFSTLQD
ncbi:aminodeoxychorismate lyase [Thiomicrospira sp. WB1]|uniref:aminodeoxychorismate lyase n=1 Tax=Thiomicrospira sp. WB1 TaxID=1685380 RepID=UPI00074AC31C|nr:aminodeoxychorismate lyase [Thiomicrospira sp. WB1]KUJ72757.1 hypothetical protein AVO41_02930 [Thiomicrospira sp. WB1]